MRVDSVDNPSLRDLLAGGMEHLRSARLPIFSISDATICGYELLIRGPGKFRNPELLFKAGLSEGLMVQLDLACLSRSLDTCKQLGNVKRIHVNLFAETILAADMFQLTSQFSQLQASGESILCVELIEMAVMPEPEELLKRVRQMQNAGIEIAIDDVGCGASSVEVIVMLEPHVIKIDKRFVSGAFAEPEKSRRCERLVKLIHSLGARIVAEGVDTEEDRAFALEIGIEMGQGLLTGPLPE